MLESLTQFIGITVHIAFPVKNMCCKLCLGNSIQLN